MFNKFIILIKYWYIVIPIAFILLQVTVLNSTHFKCSTYAKKCEVTERIFVFFDIPPRDIDVSSIDDFSLKSVTPTIPILGNDGHWYRIYANKKDGSKYLFMESYHSDKKKAEKITAELNDAINKMPINIDIRF